MFKLTWLQDLSLFITTSFMVLTTITALELSGGSIHSIFIAMILLTLTIVLVQVAIDIEYIEYTEENDDVN